MIPGAVRIWGLGHVGLVTAAGLLVRGRNVIAIDSDPSAIARVERDGGLGTSPAAMRRLVLQALRGGRLVLGSDSQLAATECDADVICVNAPNNGDGTQSLAAVLNVLECIDVVRARTRTPHLAVLRTTVVPGTCDRVLAPTLARQARRSRRPASRLVMHPAFVRRCDFESDWRGRVVVGATEETAFTSFFRAFALDPHVSTRLDRVGAELVKYVDNAFHATKVAFANECGRVASALGRDPRAILAIVASEPLLNASAAYLEPGEPFAGPCLPKDMQAFLEFIASVDVDAPLLSGVELSNRIQADSKEGRFRRKSVA
jgi:GDP-mannose 6-dehydrogenase